MLSPVRTAGWQALPNVASVVVWHRGRTVLRKGRVGRAAQAEPRSILLKALEPTPDLDGLTEPTFIPDLQVCVPTSWTVPGHYTVLARATWPLSELLMPV
jgi:hypothetical protein